MAQPQTTGQKVAKNLQRLKKAIKLAIKAARAVFRSARRVAYVVSSVGFPVVLALLGILMAIIVIVTIINIGPKFIGFGGSDEETVNKIIALGDQDQLKERIDEEVGDAIAVELDCSSRAPSERRPEPPNQNCIEGLLAALEAERNGGNKSPVPERANFMVPVWQAAGRKYQVPWKLLAAIEGARTNFGLRNCEDREQGSGVYRILDSNWSRYATNGGAVGLEPSAGSCFTVIDPDEAVEAAGSDKEAIAEAKDKYRLVLAGDRPIKSLSDDLSGRQKSKNALLSSDPLVPAAGGSENIYDPVDAAYTQARILAHNGAFKTKEWDYSGSGPGQCSTDPQRDGEVWYYQPSAGQLGPGSGRYGYNSKLKIPTRALVIADKYTRAPKWKPRASLSVPSMPKKDLVYLLRVAWSAFGVRGAELNRNVTLNYAQIGRESGGSPQLIQVCDGSYADINCDNNDPARGLMQFIPSTFASWKVDGFDNIYNPLDNILAAVNAQVNTEMSILDGSSGWGPGSGSNPYKTGGKARNTVPASSGGKKGKPIPATPYKGKAQDDRVSEAVAYKSPGSTHSDCYTAVVNQWYEEIKKNPPASAMSLSGPVGQRIVKIAQMELKKGVAESGGDNVPRYRTGKIAPYNISTMWCQSFAAWVWYQAGVKQIAKVPGMMTSSGLALPSYTGAVTAAAQQKQYGLVFKTKNPQPGDMAFYSDRHVEIVEKVANGRVISTIGGNTSNAVIRVSPPSGITHFVAVPGNVGKSSYKFGPSKGKTVDIEKSFTRLTKKLDVEGGIAVSRGGKTALVGDLQAGHAWSTIKLPIIVALVKERGGYDRLSAEERQLVGRAIRSSNNQAAAALFSRIAPTPARARAKIDGLFAAVGDNTEVNGANSAPPFSTYGQTSWTLRAANRFYLGLAQGKFLNRSSTRALLDQLERITPSQQWGLGAKGFNLNRFKGGWGPDRAFDGRYLLRQTGLKGKTAISIMVVPKEKAGFGEISYAASVIGVWLKRNFRNLPEPSPDPNLTTKGRGSGSGPEAAGKWIKVGATWYDETTPYNKPKYKGLTYAELLVAGANAGLKRHALGSTLGLNNPNWVGMPMGTPLLIKVPGRKKVIKIYKIDNGSGQGGEKFFKIDLNSGTVRALGFNPATWGRKTVLIAKARR